jgi:hypothetical protein
MNIMCDRSEGYFDPPLGASERDTAGELNN